jgi:hypothetical protein
MAIYYPRMCDHCNHVSNNPSAWHYHKRKHEPIPDGQLCEGGCGQPAVIRNTRGTYKCDENAHSCPQYRKEHSDRIKMQWQENLWTVRRQAVAGLMKDPEIIEKQVKRANATKRRRMLSDIWTKERRRYVYAVHKLTMETYEKHKDEINPDNLPLGRFEYHIDHKVSKLRGWIEKIPPETMARKENLEILWWRDNVSKNAQCSMLIEDLISLQED